MRFLVIISLLLTINVFGQETIEANPGEYLPAENYGGKVELKRFLQQEMNYPSIALENQEEGTVELRFVVDAETGRTSQLQVHQSVSKELDEEAIRLQQMLLFKPSYYLGDRVTTHCSLKIKFSISTYKRYCKKRGYDQIDFSDDIDWSNTIYRDNQVDVKPRIIFADSLDNIATFLSKNLKYPEGTRKLNITGTVKLSFIVEPTGRITNIKVERGVGGGASNETERLLKLLTWLPGEKDGKKVRVSRTFEVDYKLTNDAGYDYVPSKY
ncbi:MAG: TonB family protein [Flavobacteriales bacterium]|nr:TonB family protein [Flavobacteriales bacterium]